MKESTRIGMIVPSSNTCLEPQTYRILGDRTDVTVHFTRIEVTRIGLDSGSATQFDHEAMIEAARLLRTAEVDVLAWNGTAGSWLGAGHDRGMAEQITKHTGVPATTSTLAYLAAFDRFDLNRIALITPYTADVNEAIIEVYGQNGVDIVNERHLGLEVNESFARVRPEELLPFSLELAGSDAVSGSPQALVYLCTNLYAAPIVEQVEKQTGLAALDSVAVTLWHCLTMAGANGLSPRWGRLLV